MVNGLDPYELPRREWYDDVDKWPETSLVDVTVFYSSRLALSLKKKLRIIRAWSAIRDSLLAG